MLTLCWNFVCLVAKQLDELHQHIQFLNSKLQEAVESRDYYANLYYSTKQKLETTRSSLHYAMQHLKFISNQGTVRSLWCRENLYYWLPKQVIKKNHGWFVHLCLLWIVKFSLLKFPSSFGNSKYGSITDWGGWMEETQIITNYGHDFTSYINTNKETFISECGSSWFHPQQRHDW